MTLRVHVGKSCLVVLLWIKIMDGCKKLLKSTISSTKKISLLYSSSLPVVVQPGHRVETYRDVTDRCKHCGRLRFHVPTFFQATGRKMINCACSASLKLVVIRSSSNQMHASSNLPSVRTKKVGTLVTSLYVSTLWPGSTPPETNFLL
jgi:hypothetical protein